MLMFKLAQRCLALFIPLRTCARLPLQQCCDTALADNNIAAAAAAHVTLHRQAHLLTIWLCYFKAALWRNELTRSWSLIHLKPEVAAEFMHLVISQELQALLNLLAIWFLSYGSACGLRFDGFWVLLPSTWSSNCELLNCAWLGVYIYLGCCCHIVDVYSRGIWGGGFPPTGVSCRGVLLYILASGMPVQCQP